jgi:FMN reductase
LSHVLAVSGSPMEVSRSAVLLGHVSGILKEHGHTVDTLTLRELPPEALLHAHYDHPAIVDAAARLEKADGLIVATPVYKAAFSGLLKTWLDLLPQFGLAGKVVLPLATGGSVAHALALDYALRPVLTSMEARHVVNGFLVLDRFIESPTSGDLSAIHEDAAPALGRIIEGFLEGLKVVGGVAA